MDDQDKSPDYLRGFTAGYQQAKAEELAHYAAMVQSGREVYDRVIRGLIEVPSFADREATRLDTLREAHAAELHVGRPVLDVSGRKGCPVCMEARAITEPWPAGGPDWCGVEIRHLPHPWSLSGDVLGSAPDRRCPGTDAPLKRGPVPAHNGHYGAHPETCIKGANGHCLIRGCPDADPCAGGCSDPAAHAEGAHDV